MIGNKHVICILLLFTWAHLQAQRITGAILNATDEAPMTGCVVSANGKEIGVVDNDGMFSVSKEDGITELSFMFVGMHSFKIKVAQTPGDADLGTLYMFESPRSYYLKKGIATDHYKNGKI